MGEAPGTRLQAQGVSEATWARRDTRGRLSCVSCLAGEGARATWHALGMSYEITDARIDDLRAAVWTVSECTFTGAAILRRDKAAYRDTWIELL